MGTETNIPKHWQLRILREVCDKISLNNIKIKQQDYLQEGKFPVVDQGQELVGGYYNDEKLIVPNDPPYIIFGDHTKVKKFVNFKFIAGADGVKVLKPHSIYDAKFFYYLIQTVKIPNKGYARHFQFLEKEQIPLPPLPEQHAIVSKIEELFSALDNGKQQLETAQQQLKVYRQSLLKAAFEGKLTRLNHDSPDLPDTLDLKAKRNQGHQENLTNQDADKSTLPKGWKEIRFKDIVHVNPKLPNKENISLDIEVQFLPMKLVEEVINKIHLTEIRKFSEVQKGSYTPFVDGDVIFAKVTPCMENGKIAVVDNLKNKIGYGSSEFHVIRCSENIKNKYAFYFLVQEKFRKEAENAMTGAVGLRRVPKQFIENYFIPLAPLEEQELIVSELESRLTVCDKLEETIAHALQQAETIRQSILKKAFEGKLS